MLTAATEAITFSVVIPAYNAASSIECAVDSVIAQTHAAREIIVVNDGSTDATPAILQRYGDRVRVVSQANAGLSAARNRGIEEANAEYVAFLDADDKWLPEKLAHQAELLAAADPPGFVACAARIENERGEDVATWEFQPEHTSLLRQIFVRNAAIPGSGSGVAVRRDLFDEVGGFDVTLTSLEDIDMWMRLAARTTFACSPTVLCVINRHDASMSTNFSRMLDNARRVFEKNRDLLPPADRDTFWRAAYSGMLTDYAKWAYRSGSKLTALRLLLESLVRSRARSRLAAGLAWAMLRRQQV